MAAIGQGILYPLISYTAKGIADAVIARATPDMLRWVLWELAVAGGIVGLARLAMDARMLLRSRMRLEARLLIVHKASELELAELVDPAVQDQLDSARGAADMRPLVVVNETLAVVRCGVSLICYSIMLSVFSTWTLLFLVVVIPGAAAELWRGKLGGDGHRRRAGDARRLRYFHDTVFADSAAAENRIYGVAPRMIERAHGIGQHLISDERGEWRRSLPISLACQMIPTLVINGIYLYMAVATVRGELTIGELTLYGMSLTGSQRLSQTLLLSVRAVLDGWEPLRGLFGFLDRPERATPARLEAVPKRATLRFEGVSFRYPGAEAWTIRNVDLEIAPGEFVAIVGGNGDGKTTLLKLLVGLLEPTEGRITIAGRELAAWDTGQLRRCFAVLFQDFARYGFSAYENVAVGTAAAEPDEIAAALRASSADEVIAQLPYGGDTELIASLPGGAGLSGGQWQRLALARAFVRNDADFVVLDEPTSALDAETEQRVIEHLRAEQGAKAIVLITHRSALLRPTDKIVLLDRGRLVRENASTLLRHPRWTSGDPATEVVTERNSA
ncbi:MAG: ABC transporter ATP-binding protein/permease [Myxococcota bacterium]|nr:ABC transporter ATP-binding protein/permease [Myxococcota bacterium]